MKLVTGIQVMAAVLILCRMYLIHASSIGSGFVCDPETWKTGGEMPGFVDSLVRIWCNVTSQDAVKQARIMENELRSCNQGKLECNSAVKSCEEQRIKENFECKEQKSSLEAKVSGVHEESLAQVAYWKEKCKNRINIAECDHQKQVAISKCEVEGLSTNAGNDSQHELSCSEKMQSYETKMKYLEESLGSCRLKKAYADATRENSTEAELVKKLKEQIERLYLILAICGALSFGMIPPAIFLVVTRKGEKQVDTREKLKVHTPTETCEIIEHMHKGSHGPLRPILTSLVVQGEESFFLLVPFNPSRKRMFALFGKDGDYSREVEMARDIVDGKDLLIVIYHQNGHAFSEEIFDILQMRPEAIAQRAVPINTDFPTKDDIAVLWTNYRQDFLSTADGLLNPPPDVFWEQAWVQYLIKNCRGSGRV